MAKEVYMNIPEVEGMSNTLHDVSEVLKAVAKTLRAIADALKSNFFTGIVGAGVIAFIEFVEPIIKKIAEKCAELSKDVKASVTAYKNGDAAGSTRFY
jgi:hypothetical protein